MDDYVREWARVQMRIKQARKFQLSILGYTEDSLRDLQQQASAQMNGQMFVTTEYGIVQKVVDKPVQWFSLRSADPTKQTWGNKLQLITERA